MAVLSALVAAVAVSAREYSKVVVDISHMRQLSQANAMYAADHDTVMTLWVPPLVELGYAEDSITASPVDDSPRGFAQHMQEDLWGVMDTCPRWETTYRISYVGWFDICQRRRTFDDHTAHQPYAGWLIFYGRGERYIRTVTGERVKLPPSDLFFGPYHRLLIEGSVIARRPRFPYGQPVEFWFHDGPRRPRDL